MKRLTKEDGRKFLQRWRAVNERECQELRDTPPEQKLRQLGSLLALAQGLGWNQLLGEGEEETRRRWQQIRKSYER